MSGGKKTTQTTTYDPAMQNMVTGNVSRAQSLADSIKPYDGKLTADQQGLLGNYFDAAQAIQGAGQQYLGSAAGAAQQALGYTPMLVQPGQMTAATAGQASAVDPRAALGLLGNPAQVDRSSIRDVNLGAVDVTPFLNPATQSIVDASMADIERARQVQQAHDAQKFGAGSWGGSRQGIEGAKTNEAFQRTGASASADLRGRAFDSALQGALAARGQDLQGLLANQNVDLNTGTFNAGQRNAGQQFAAGLLGDLSSFNVGQQNARAENEATRLQDASKTNLNSELEAALANQRALSDQAGLQLQAGGLLGNLGSQDVARALGLTGLLGTAAGVQQGLAQDALDREAANYQQGITNALNAQQTVNSATGIIPSITNNTQTQKTSGGLLGTLGTLAAGVGALGLAPFTGGMSLGGLGGLLGGGAAAGALGSAGLNSVLGSSLGSAGLFGGSALSPIRF
jgi:hypothetical protein